MKQLTWRFSSNSSTSNYNIKHGIQWEHANAIHTETHPIDAKNTIYICAKNAWSAKTLNYIANTGRPVPSILSPRRGSNLNNNRMKKDSHEFVHNYSGLGAFGMDRKTDEETLMFYLQKFSEDHFLALLIPRLSDHEIEELYLLINNKLKQHLSEDEYHQVFLKDR
jgi:hypothetical protein